MVLKRPSFAVTNMKNPNTLRMLFCKYLSSRPLRFLAPQVLATLLFVGAAHAQGAGGASVENQVAGDTALDAATGAPSTAPQSVDVAGIALNGTTMKPASNLALELINANAQASGNSLLATARSGADGRFKFPPRTVNKTDLLLIRAPFQGYGYLAAAYDGAQLFKASGISPRPGAVQVDVYNSSTKPPELTFQVHHLAIESSPKGIKCIERIVVQNPSNSTYTGIGKVKGTVLLDVPAGARDIKMDPKIPGTLVKTSHGWAATTPIAPSRYVNRNPLAGPSAIIFEYYMDWPSVLPWARTLSLSQRVLYPTNFFFVARKTDDRVLQVTAPRLGKDEEQQLPIGQETETRVVNAIGRPIAETPALNADEHLEISIKREVNPLFWAFVAFLAAIVLAVPLALRGARKRSAAAEDWEDEGPYEDEELVSQQAAVAGRASEENGALRNLGENRGAERGAGARVSTAYSGSGALEDGLLRGRERAQIEAIAQLDEEFEAGRLGEAEYRRRRAQSKNRLLDLLETDSRSRPSR